MSNTIGAAVSWAGWSLTAARLFGQSETLVIVGGVLMLVGGAMVAMVATERMVSQWRAS